MASFLSSLTEPLHTYAARAFIFKVVDDDNDAGRLTSGDRLDELEISTRSRLLELVEELLSGRPPRTTKERLGGDDAGAMILCDGSESSSSTDAIVGELMRYLKDVTLLCSRAAGHYSSCTSPTPAGGEGSLYPHPPTSLAAVKRLPFLLLEDAIDSLPLEHVQTLWSGGGGGGLDNHPKKPPPHVSSYATSLLCSPAIFDNVQSKFALLRICNKLLRAIGNDRGGEGDAEFAGGVMLMLSKVFPLSERSAVNVLGTFNVANVTKFDDGSSSPGGGEDVGSEFYKKFWGLQRALADPHGTILSSRGGPSQEAAVESYDAFFRDVGAVLAALESTPVLPESSSSSSSSAADDSVPTVRRHKYLTAPGLLPLQLKDARLRTHILIQLLLALSHLASPNVTLPGPQPATRQRTLIAQAERRAAALLMSTTTTTSSPLGGERVTRFLAWILGDRETMWRAWKRAKCMPAHDRVGGAAGNSVVDGSAIRRALLSGRKRKANAYSADVDAKNVGSGGGDVGGKDDVRISDLPGITSRITESLPTLETFLDPYVEALDPENGIEGEYHPRNDKVYCWRALRMLARDQRNRGQLCRFDKLRRRDGDFEGIVRDMWREEARGDIGGSTLDVDYYAGHADWHEAMGNKGMTGAGDDALQMMDDVSVGTPEEETQSKLDKLAEFSRAAMEVEEEMLYDDLDQVEVESTKVCKGDIAENAISADAKSEEEKDLSGKSLSQGAPAETVVLITRNKDAMDKAVEVKPENPVSKNTSAALSSKKNAQPAASVNEKSASSPAVRNAASSDEINHKGKTFSPGDTNKFKWSRKDEQTTTSRETSNASGSSFNGSRGNQKNDENPTSSTARAKFTPPQKFQEQQQQEVEQGKDTSAVRYSWRRGSTADGRGRDGNDQQPQQLQPQSQQQSRITPTNNQAKWDAPSTHNQRKWDGRDDGSRSANHRGGAVDTSKGRDVKSLSPTLNSTKHLSSGNGNDVGGGGPPNGGGVVGGQGRGGWEPPPRGGSGREGSHGRGAGRGRGYHDRNNEKSNTGRDRR